MKKEPKEDSFSRPQKHLFNTRILLLDRSFEAKMINKRKSNRKIQFWRNKVKRNTFGETYQIRRITLKAIQLNKFLSAIHIWTIIQEVFIYRIQPRAIQTYTASILLQKWLTLFEHFFKKSRKSTKNRLARATTQWVLVGWPRIKHR